jgi:hypothetical protein
MRASPFIEGRVSLDDRSGVDDRHPQRAKPRGSTAMELGVRVVQQEEKLLVRTLQHRFPTLRINVYLDQVLAFVFLGLDTG